MPAPGTGASAIKSTDIRAGNDAPDGGGFRAPDPISGDETSLLTRVTGA